MRSGLVITIGKLDHGGAELRLLSVLKSVVVSRGMQVTVYVISGQKGALTAEFLASGVKIKYGRPGILGLFGLLWFLLVKRPKVLHVNASLAGGIYCFAGWLAGVPVRLSHIRTTGDYSRSFGYRLKKSFYKKMLNSFSTSVVGVCDGAKQFAGANSGNWVTVYNGVDATFECCHVREDVSPGRLIVIGRMHEAKNQVFAVEVLAALCCRYPSVDWFLDFFGKECDSIKQEIIKQANVRGVINRIAFNGITNSPVETISNYSVLLLPSVREGLPGVVLEAASCGVPSVCSPLPGCLEIADRLSFVRTVGLTSANDWADEVVRVSECSRRENAVEFSSSNFTFDKHRLKMLSLWGEI